MEEGKWHWHGTRRSKNIKGRVYVLPNVHHFFPTCLLCCSPLDLHPYWLFSKSQNKLCLIIIYYTYITGMLFGSYDSTQKLNKILMTFTSLKILCCFSTWFGLEAFTRPFLRGRTWHSIWCHAAGRHFWDGVFCGVPYAAFELTNHVLGRTCWYRQLLGPGDILNRTQTQGQCAYSKDTEKWHEIIIM